jgi:alpha-beta hydrolase superfamily lysophospholipase
MKRWSRSVLAVLAVSFATTVSPVPARASTIDCGQVCQWQWAQQQQNTLPRTAFYDTPRPLRWAPAGTLIRSKRTTDYQVQGTPTAATRILYHSRTSKGRDTAASGVVLVPPGTPPKTGWPVVVDAHGTSGIGRECAPSLMRDLYHGDQMLRFVQQGWAVVAPDYAGLGTTGRPEFLNKTGQANDVIDAVRAARQARRDLSSRWVLWGHSQGGGAALAVAERQKRHPQRGYLGAVVTSPAADLTGAVRRLAGVPGLGGFLPLVVRGASFSDQRIRPERILSSQATDRLEVTGSGCLGVVGAVYGDLTGPTLVRPGFLADPHFARYLTANSTGYRPVGGPLLLLQGDADSVIPKSDTDQVAATLCRTGARVAYRAYPGLEHDTYPGQVTGIDDGAMPDILAWTADRFAGKPAASTCR